VKPVWDGGYARQRELAVEVATFLESAVLGAPHCFPTMVGLEGWVCGEVEEGMAALSAAVLNFSFCPDERVINEGTVCREKDDEVVVIEVKMRAWKGGM